MDLHAMAPTEPSVFAQTAVREVVAPSGLRAQLLVQDYEGDSSAMPSTPTGSADGDQDAVHGAPAISSVATLCNSAIGAGVLSLPLAFEKAGVLWSLGEADTQLHNACP